MFSRFQFSGGYSPGASIDGKPINPSSIGADPAKRGPAAFTAVSASGSVIAGSYTISGTTLTGMFYGGGVLTLNGQGGAGVNTINLSPGDTTVLSLTAAGAANISGKLAVSGPIKPGVYTVATVPSAANYTNFNITVTDAAAGRGDYKSDGANWNRVGDANTVLS
jgi:hypothetical protein